MASRAERAIDVTDPAGPDAIAKLAIDRSAAPVRRRRRRWLGWAVAALVAAGVAAWVFAPRRTEVQATTAFAAYPSQRFAQLTASGYVVAQRRASVASKGTGRVVELRVREGSVVRRGELIGRLDDADVLAALSVARAAVVQGEAAVRQAEANLQQADAEAANAEVELDRQRSLREKGFVSPQAVDAAARRALAARGAVAASKAAIAIAQASLAQARAQVQVQIVNRDNTEIRAPFDGVVLVKNANVGDMLTPFSAAAGTLGALVTMADMTTLEVEADVSEANVSKVKLDQPAEIALDAFPQERFRGSVSRIVPTVDRAKATVTTKVRFERIDPRIVPEMSAKVNFLSERPADDDRKPVTAVNPRAVVERDGRKVVFRLAGDVVELVPVTPGRTLGDALEIAGGALATGDRLVLAPPPQLAAGDRVVVTGR